MLSVCHYKAINSNHTHTTLASPQQLVVTNETKLSPEKQQAFPTATNAHTHIRFHPCVRVCVCRLRQCQNTSASSRCFCRRCARIRLFQVSEKRVSPQPQHPVCVCPRRRVQCVPAIVRYRTALVPPPWNRNGVCAVVLQLQLGDCNSVLLFVIVVVAVVAAPFSSSCRVPSSSSAAQSVAVGLLFSTQRRQRPSAAHQHQQQHHNRGE